MTVPLSMVHGEIMEKKTEDDQITCTETSTLAAAPVPIKLLQALRRYSEHNIGPLGLLLLDETARRTK